MNSVAQNPEPTPELVVQVNGGCEKRSLLMTTGMLALSFIPTSSALCKEIPENYMEFVDKQDGYSYVYPSDWKEFDFTAHHSAFKDRYLQLQNVRLSFIPTDKNDIHDLDPMENVVQDLVNKLYAVPNQATFIKGIQERSVDGKNYYTFEYNLTSPNFSVTRFTIIAIANGKYYTLTVSANDRKWRRARNKLKVVVDSFKVFEIYSLLYWN
ncbi:photosynthetic NDH subunit of lumenal location 1, chloroplastic-like [Amaranthus tricolor]|uniref:photosynthetic NDH subunit of lumenal location 1, chloroplastic-like n=1 Tax=Amaranthus tricolor TaxID=29722 RepID=UPI0025908B7D|nr:photosynthetic NDH subunit of lumenal location 1, chloroplastic-like [Amaranthus tricolor]